MHKESIMTPTWGTIVLSGQESSVKISLKESRFFGFVFVCVCVGGGGGGGCC